ncbi:MAG: twin-arginine translocation signal domain-containing protein [Selenomonadaceae bacterium]|nr:twin-arginine translocation signal domain-containing protein [Selenomonadaceae bacterium]
MITRRNFIKMAGAAAVLTALPGCGSDAAKNDNKKGDGKMKEKVAGTDGDKYIPYDKRDGNESVVYFTRDLSAAGLLKIFDKVNENLTGKVAIKLHTGEIGRAHV